MTLFSRIKKGPFARRETGCKVVMVGAGVENDGARVGGLFQRGVPRRGLGSFWCRLGEACGGVKRGPASPGVYYASFLATGTRTRREEDNALGWLDFLTPNSRRAGPHILCQPYLWTDGI